MIKAFGFGLSALDKETAQKMAVNVLALEANVIDLRYHEPGEFHTDDIILLFGQKTLQLIKPLITKKQITKWLALPELSQISNKENAELRKTVLDSLQSFKQVLSTPVEKTVTITKEALSNLNVNSIVEIAKKKREWTGVLEDGRQIRLSDDDQPDKRYDINMTFNELCALKLAMEHFDLKELHLVTKENNTSSASTGNNQ